MALSQKTTGISFYVHSLEDISKIDVYKPDTKTVPDSEITGAWAIQPVKLKQVGKILCQEDAGCDGLEYTYGDGKKAELYAWNYVWGEKSEKAR